MAFRFRRTEGLGAGVRRIVDERIELAIAQLQRQGDDRHRGVHEARKRFKEIRAVLRLARYELGDRFPVENRWYRDTARMLAGARDAQAVIETWDKLVARFSDGLDGKEMTVIRSRLEHRLDRITGESGAGQGAAASVLEALPAARERLKRWPQMSDDFCALRAGAKRSYAQGRREAQQCASGDADEHFHEWRKRVKDLWYQTIVLRRIWDDVMSVRKRWLKSLSDALGDDHDLVVLRQLMADEPQLFGCERDRRDMSAVIARRQTELRDYSRDLGALLYAEKPKAYVRRIEAYWRVWRSATKR